MSGLKSLREITPPVIVSIRTATSIGTPRRFQCENAIGLTPSAADALRCDPKCLLTRPN